jgi:hypothetical protein
MFMSFEVGHCFVQGLQRVGSERACNLVLLSQLDQLTANRTHHTTRVSKAGVCERGTKWFGYLTGASDVLFLCEITPDA